MTAPPPALLLAHRLLGWRLGPAYREWLVADVRSRSWPRRRLLAIGLGAPLAAVAVAVLAGLPWWRLVVPLPLVLAIAALTPDDQRRRFLRWQGLTEGGAPAADWYDDDRRRTLRNVTSVLLAVAAAAAIAVLARTTAR